MRSTSMFYSRFWIGGTGRQLLMEFGKDHFTVAVYLFTAPSAHMSGIYYLPISAIAEHTRLSAPRVHKILDDLHRIGFSRYDPSASLVWVISMARWQISSALRTSDNRVKGLRQYLRGLPRSALIADFREHYALDLDGETPCPDEVKPLQSHSEAPSKGSYPTYIPSPPSPDPRHPGRPRKISGGEA